jgi:hypothetical protein
MFFVPPRTAAAAAAAVMNLLTHQRAQERMGMASGLMSHQRIEWRMEPRIEQIDAALHASIESWYKVYCCLWPASAPWPQGRAAEARWALPSSVAISLAPRPRSASKNPTPPPWRQNNSPERRHMHSTYQRMRADLCTTICHHLSSSASSQASAWLL